MKHFTKDFPSLGESIVCLLRNNIKKVGSEEEISQLAKKKRERPLTLGNPMGRYSSTSEHSEQLALVRMLQ